MHDYLCTNSSVFSYPHGSIHVYLHTNTHTVVCSDILMVQSIFIYTYTAVCSDIHMASHIFIYTSTVVCPVILFGFMPH